MLPLRSVVPRELPDPTPRVSRLAPSPTGSLHLGNARTFVINWAMARANAWRVLLRIEDLDTPRVKPWAIDQAQDDLRYLGLKWDGPAAIQSQTLGHHHDAMRSLAATQLVYPCSLSRSEVEQAGSAPNEGDDAGPRYPASLRPTILPTEFDDEFTNWRLACREGSATFDDRFLGSVTVHPASDVGDFVIWTKRGHPAYQLAVVVDDARAGVTEVVRGADLVESTGMQIRVHEALGLDPPRYTHLPLVRGEDGRRLAKRHGDTRLSRYREAGVPGEAVIGLLARWSGISEAFEPMLAAVFRDRFSLDRLPAGDITFTQEDDDWLMSHASR